MNFTDTHTHLYYEQDLEKQSQLMERCFENDVNRLFLPNVDLKSIAMIDDLVNKYPENCFAMAGLHPCDVKDDYLAVLDEIYNSIPNRKIYAIGEIGIDLYWDKTTLAIQQDAFRKQIAWAKDLDLPIVIHCREAFEEVFEVLESERDEKLRGIFHCFTGNVEQARQAIDLNFYLGIGGVVTYKKAGLDLVLSEISLQNLVLETDSPYLAPVPFRGKPNESSYLIYIAEKLADIYGVSIEEIANITTENSKKIFRV
ncbi:TatD DNase family protein [Pedobacter psychrotolerans]|uniref:TatD DNase family protein n=1 Tax=Pedobacter psychrotolerans TaxID=1843235 RepID=A0A4R2HID1_9SPHI|nr:TatD family hydrolase [Pedobacter psychrotolerans]TCO29041.1 TatD DNase family protein [Pedobacter psychrotolerans]GGE53610.1 TatD family hydrolase [Pedobacter psychrotolerans]